jgi:hypothetical protein
MITGGGEASGSAVVQAAPSPPVGQFHPGPSSQGVQVRTALIIYGICLSVCLSLRNAALLFRAVIIKLTRTQKGGIREVGIGVLERKGLKGVVLAWRIARLKPITSVVDPESDPVGSGTLCWSGIHPLN